MHLQVPIFKYSNKDIPRLLYRNNFQMSVGPELGLKSTDLNAPVL